MNRLEPNMILTLGSFTLLIGQKAKPGVFLSSHEITSKGAMPTELSEPSMTSCSHSFNWFPTCSDSWTRSNISFTVNKWITWPTLVLILQPTYGNPLDLFLDWPWFVIFVSLHMLMRETPNRAMSA
jgi:hypothetical protein